MINNFQTLISAILTKTSSLFAKKEDVYTKEQAASKDEVEVLISKLGLNKAEVQTMITDAIENDVQTMITDAVENDVQTMINNAIGDAIGGSY